MKNTRPKRHMLLVAILTLALVLPTFSLAETRENEVAATERVEAPRSASEQGDKPSDSQGNKPSESGSENVNEKEKTEESGIDKKDESQPKDKSSDTEKEKDKVVVQGKDKALAPALAPASVDEPNGTVRMDASAADEVIIRNKAEFLAVFNNMGSHGLGNGQTEPQQLLKKISLETDIVVTTKELKGPLSLFAVQFDGKGHSITVTKGDASVIEPLFNRISGLNVDGKYHPNTSVTNLKIVYDGDVSGYTFAKQATTVDALNADQKPHEFSNLNIRVKGSVKSKQEEYSNFGVPAIRYWASGFMNLIDSTKIANVDVSVDGNIGDEYYFMHNGGRAQRRAMSVGLAIRSLNMSSTVNVLTHVDGFSIRTGGDIIAKGSAESLAAGLGYDLSRFKMTNMKVDVNNIKSTLSGGMNWTNAPANSHDIYGSFGGAAQINNLTKSTINVRGNIESLCENNNPRGTMAIGIMYMDYLNLNASPNIVQPRTITDNKVNVGGDVRAVTTYEGELQAPNDAEAKQNTLAAGGVYNSMRPFLEQDDFSRNSVKIGGSLLAEAVHGQAQSVGFGQRYAGDGTDVQVGGSIKAKTRKNVAFAQGFSFTHRGSNNKAVVKGDVVAESEESNAQAYGMTAVQDSGSNNHATLGNLVGKGGGIAYFGGYSREYRGGSKNTVELKKIDAVGVNGVYGGGYTYTTKKESDQQPGSIDGIKLNIPEGISVTATNGPASVGGFLYNSEGAITNSSIKTPSMKVKAMGGSTGTSYVGGFSSLGKIETNNTAEVEELILESSGTSYLGGYSGYMVAEAKVENGKAHIGKLRGVGDVDEKSAYIGGFVGHSAGKISEGRTFVKDFEVSANRRLAVYVGGFAGRTFGTNSIINSGALVDDDLTVKGDYSFSTVGGFTGIIYGSKYDTVSAQVGGSIVVPDAKASVGGFAGSAAPHAVDTSNLSKPNIENATALVFGDLNVPSGRGSVMMVGTKDTTISNSGAYVGGEMKTAQTEKPSFIYGIDGGELKDVTWLKNVNPSSGSPLSEKDYAIDVKNTPKFEKLYVVDVGGEGKAGKRVAYDISYDSTEGFQKGGMVGSLTVHGRSFQDQYWGKTAEEYEVKMDKVPYIANNTLPVVAMGADSAALNNAVTTVDVPNYYVRHLAIRGENSPIYDIWGMRGAEVFKITYDGNGNTAGEVPKDDKLYGENEEGTVLEKGDLSKEGYIFKGWTLKKDESGDKVFKAGDKIAMTENVTLYALWEKAKPPVVPEKPIKPEKPAKPEVSVEKDSGKTKVIKKAIKTGDSVGITIPAALLLISATIMLILARRRFEK